MGALLLGTISTAAPAASLVETAEARQEAPLFRPRITAAGQADLGQASLLALGPQVALLQVAAPVAGTLPTILDMVETVALNGPKASSLPWWSGMACPNAGAAGAWRGQPLDTGWAGIGKRTWSSAISGAKSATLRKAPRPRPSP